jgi:hypothetical protein
MARKGAELRNHTEISTLVVWLARLLDRVRIVSIRRLEPEGAHRLVHLRLTNYRSRCFVRPIGFCPGHTAKQSQPAEAL